MLPRAILPGSQGYISDRRKALRSDTPPRQTAGVTQGKPRWRAVRWPYQRRTSPWMMSRAVNCARDSSTAVILSAPTSFLRAISSAFVPVAKRDNTFKRQTLSASPLETRPEISSPRPWHQHATLTVAFPAAGRHQEQSRLCHGRPYSPRWTHRAQSGSGRSNIFQADFLWSAR